MQNSPLFIPRSTSKTHQQTDFENRDTLQQRGTDISPAPMESITNGPSTGSAELPKIAPVNFAQNFAVKTAAKRPSKHLMYAVEILVFAIVGWGWLAIREFMSAPPIMDISVFICLLISSAVNLGMALIYYTTDQFKPAAMGFFSHALSIWVLYIYSLIESTTGGWDPLCCNGQSSYSLTKTYAAAYFGGLPFHQTVGAVTLGFISVFLILAAGQVRVCVEDPRSWLLRKVSTSLTCLISLYLGLFALKSGACGGGNTGSIVIAAAILAWILMADIVPMIIALFVFLQDEVKELIQMISELTLTLTSMAVSAVLSSTLGGRASSTLILIFVGIILWQIGAIVFQSMTIRILNQQKSLAAKRTRSQHASETDDYSPSAPPLQSIGTSYGSTWQYTRPVMLLPDLREMRLHETQRRDKTR